MLTIDDVNTIIKKYGKSGFWQTIDLGKLNFENMPMYSSGRWFNYDGIRIHANAYPPNDPMTIHIYFSDRNYTTRIGYLSYDQGETSTVEGVDWWADRIRLNIDKSILKNNPPIFYLYVTTNPTTLPNKVTLYRCLFVPLSSLQIPVINGEFDNKLYIKVLGDLISAYTINGNSVTLEEDEKGKFFNLPSATDCIIGTKNDAVDFPLYNVTFREFKTLPILSIPTIYKGNTQTIQLLDDTEEITEFQAYYKGELLTDNKITLPYDADDYIDITVDLLDNRYPNSTLKLKAPTQMYIANSQSDVETAISQGITTLQVGDTETEVLLNNIELSNITLVDSNIQLTNSTLNNCTILNSQYTDNGANTITNTVIRNTDYTNTSKSVYENTSFYNCRIQDSELQITGTIYECELTNSLIISDGTININNNTFTGIGSKTYFPSHLYLTGDYIVSGNTFNLTGTFTELQFNMCLIKATNDFNVGDFINKNTFDLNIEYGTENPSTLYYNIVDDDKIRARRV